MSHDKNPFLLLGGILLIILGIITGFYSFLSFSGNGYAIYGMLALGGILLLIALISHSHGSVGLVMAGLWLIIMGIFNLYHIRFIYDNLIFAALPVVAGILLITGI